MAAKEARRKRAWERDFVGADVDKWVTLGFAAKSQPQ